MKWLVCYNVYLKINCKNNFKIYNVSCALKNFYNKLINNFYTMANKNIEPKFYNKFNCLLLL